jgi:hypothetical protein
MMGFYFSLKTKINLGMGIDVLKIGGWALTATVAVLGIIKFRLIEELVKKITSDGKARGYTIMLLFGIIIVLSILTVNISGPASETIEAISSQEQSPLESTAEKTDLEKEVELGKEVLNTTKELVSEVKENKRKKDSIFSTSLATRWVYKIGDWTDDEDRILEIHKKISPLGNIKLFRQKKQYLFIKEDDITQGEMEASLDSMKRALDGLPISMLNLNTFLTRRRDKMIGRIETFGKRSNKIKLECLKVD